MSMPDWIRLIAKLRSTDRDAQREGFSRIYEAYEPMVWMLCRRAGRRDHQDVFQEVMVKLWELVADGQIENLRPDSAHAYFCRMIRNVIHDQGREIVRDTSLSDAIFQGKHQDSPDLKALLPWPLPNWATQEEFLEALRNHLSEEDRKLLGIWAERQHDGGDWTETARQRGFWFPSPRATGRLEGPYR